MSYVVINKFKDKDGHVYEVNKPYPHKGKVTKARLEELSKVNKKYKVAFIKEVKTEGTKKEQPVEEVKEDNKPKKEPSTKK